MKTLIFSILLFVASICECKPPELTPKDARIKLEEVLKAHVTYRSLTTELIKRALGNYLEEVDPAKTYFIESDIAKWENPSQEFLESILEGYKVENFSSFEDIHDLMIAAIKRRNFLEKEIAEAPLPAGVKPIEFKDLSWAKDSQELMTRLIRIKALQAETAEKLNPEAKQQLLLRLNKRRINREEELIAHSMEERRQIVLSFVLKSITAAMDSQTAYFTPAEANQFRIQVQQRLSGIGAQLRDDLNGFSIVRILDNGPASFESKLKIGDRIIAVDGEPVVGMEITEAVELIRGPQGTPVQLTLLREIGEENDRHEEKLEIEITRGEVVLKESRFEISYEPYGDGVIAILHLFSFYQDSKSSSAADLSQALETLKKDHLVKGVVLDLRNNGGGLLPQAVYVTGLFIKKGVVVSIKDNTGVIQHLRNVEGKPAWEGPLVVLVNRTSASASEIVAQTLQDYGRALIIGDPETYGKGTFQTFTLEASNYGKVNPKGEFKVTRGRYYTVSGKSPQLIGVKADIVVPGLFSELEIGEKYSKYPLETDLIPSSFDDDLADIPFIHRAQVMRLYKNNLQPILNTYNPYLQQLCKNSSQRIAMNPNYQNFLKETKRKDFSSESIEIFGQTDLQQKEALNIMKDLIFCLEQNSQTLPLSVGN